MDPHTQRAEAERWLGIAVKLLTARDFVGSKTFAIRARESDPNNTVSDQILAVVDTVLAAEKRVNSNQQPDWYGVLQLPRLIRDADLIADHYRRLVLCLNPERNRFPFADYALQLVMDAWSVLSDPNKKWLFDNELALYLQQSEQPHQAPQQPAVVQQPAQQQVVGSGSSQLNTFQFFQPQPQQQQQQQQPPPPPQQQPQQVWQQQWQTPDAVVEKETTGYDSSINFNNKVNNNDGINDGINGNVEDDNHDENEDEAEEEEVECFWTACPYCYYIFEYEKMYKECTLRCQHCRRGFHAVEIPNPPPISKGRSNKDKGKGNNSFCCWGFYPLGFSMMAWKKQTTGSRNWVPFSPMFNVKN